MSASTGDKVTDTRNSARPVTATVTNSRSAGGASLSCDSLAGWPDTTKSKVHFVTYKIDSNSDPVAGTQLDCSGIVSGSTINSFTVIDGNDVGHAVGDKVEMLPTAAWGQDLADALTNQHSRLGAHVGINNTGGLTTDTLIVTSGSTLPAGDIGAADISGINKSLLTTDSNPYKFYAYRSAAFTSGNSLVTLVLDAELFDTNNNFNISTGRYTAPVSGYYQFNVLHSATIIAGGGHGVALAKNGSEILGGTISVNGATGFNCSDATGGLLQLVAGDYIELLGYGSGGAGVPGALNTYLSGYLMCRT